MLALTCVLALTLVITQCTDLTEANIDNTDETDNALCMEPVIKPYNVLNNTYADGKHLIANASCVSLQQCQLMYQHPCSQMMVYHNQACWIYADLYSKLPPGYVMPLSQSLVAYSTIPDNQKSLHNCPDSNDSEWTIFLRTEGKDGGVAFDRDFAQYRAGFGKPKNRWLGLDTIYQMCNISVKCDLRVDILFQRPPPRYTYAAYSNFYLSGPDDYFRLYFGDYRGTAGNGFNPPSSPSRNMYGKMFSTKDQDNDDSSLNCAVSYPGGWWYTQCFRSFLTADPNGSSETRWDGKNVETAEMMLRVYT